MGLLEVESERRVSKLNDSCLLDITMPICSSCDEAFGCCHTDVDANVRFDDARDVKRGTFVHNSTDVETLSLQVAKADDCIEEQLRSCCKCVERQPNRRNVGVMVKIILMVV